MSKSIISNNYGRPYLRTDTQCLISLSTDASLALREVMSEVFNYPHFTIVALPVITISPKEELS